MSAIVSRIADELSVERQQVTAAVRLLDDGSTVPFIARYRKEATGGLTDIHLRALEERLRYLRELDAEKVRVRAAIVEQDKLTPDLARRIDAADTKARLEDLYLPFKSRRRTKAQKAREAGLEPLLDALLADPSQDPEAAAARYVDAAKEIETNKAALDGAKQILMERLGEDADLMEMVRERLRSSGRLKAAVVEGQEAKGATFRDYFSSVEDYHSAPSHRVLAMLRGREQGILTLDLVDDDHEAAEPYLQRLVALRAGVDDKKRPSDKLLKGWARLAWKARVKLRCELALMTDLRQRAEKDAIEVFAANLRDLLLAAPAGPRITMGLDPGIRTGVKVAVVDNTGKLIDTATVYPFQPRNDEVGTLRVLSALVQRHNVELIAIGNGTASRETDRLSAKLIKQLPPDGRPTKIVVSEAGASVYSASALASAELPDVDVSIRGAVSIARRLQDPLAELVKIDPRSIGVGQYQHDVSTYSLNRSLEAVVEDCVNAVGVDLNTASPALLSRVAGLTAALADNIVAWRDLNGSFSDRQQLLKVSRLGPRTFEQCAGFLRIRDGDNPLDASSVHPEAYPLVERIAAQTERSLTRLIGDSRLLNKLDPKRFADERFGVPTVRDILAELDKPGRDPRPTFKTASFSEGVETMEDLREGMQLEGVVTNVTAFGAFVDIGVHQDGLVHISQLADRYVSDPREVVKAGQVVKVKVTSVDLPRKRIALTMRKNPSPSSNSNNRSRDREPPRQQQQQQQQRPQSRPSPAPASKKEDNFGSLGDLLKKAGIKKRRR
ncbi:MAG: hypothetical protein ACI8S6_003293 [Myxococcota bacterium]|jgi:uncharacterized protein